MVLEEYKVVNYYLSVSRIDIYLNPASSFQKLCDSENYSQREPSENIVYQFGQIQDIDRAVIVDIRQFQRLG